jgi:hypothetical protein
MYELNLHSSLRQSLNLNQKIGYSQLLSLQQILKDHDTPNALKGYEGMRKAHEILIQKSAQGVLIGGLAKAVWNKRRTKSELEQHKDVDVAVIKSDFELSEPFECGIDWWLPKTANLRLSSYGSNVENISKTWYENGNNLVLSTGITAKQTRRHGLYIPSPSWIEEMIVYETLANVDTTNTEIDIDNEVIEKFRKKISSKIGGQLPKFIRESFKDYVLAPHYQDFEHKLYPEIDIVEFDLETLRAIQKYKSGII